MDYVMKHIKTTDKIVNELLNHLAPNCYIGHGLNSFSREDAAKAVEFIRNDLLASASEGFEDYLASHDQGILWSEEDNGDEINLAERVWQACSLSHAKKMQEKDAEIERLEKEVINRNQYKLNQEGLDKAHTIYEEEIQKLQHQLEIQTKRVENLKKMFMYGDVDKYTFLEVERDQKDYAIKDVWMMEEESDLDQLGERVQWGVTVPKMVGGKLARSCQAIDQELEKQLEEVNAR